MEQGRARERPENICLKCGKTIVAGSRGSITSWLFRPPECGCESSRTGLVAIDSATNMVVPSVKEGGSDRLTSAPDPRFSPGTVINGRYAVIGHLGAGGMGTVYRVLDEATSSIVALKMIGSHLIEEEVVKKRFEQEARALQTLTHPNIVAVHDVGTAEGDVPYLIMEYIEGQNLENLLNSQCVLDFEQTVGIFVQVLDALSYAHAHGVIHRDLKPSNILLQIADSRVTTVKIVDFGIAKIIQSDGVEPAKLTKPGDPLGSPFYMSPEQCRGASTDSRSDIYSVGCMIYEAISGRPPFESKNPFKIILQHISRIPPPLQNIGTGAELQPLVMRCLAKDPIDRYASAEAVRIDLERIRDGKEPLAVPRRVRKRLHFRYAVIAAVAIPTLLALGILCFHWFYVPSPTLESWQSVSAGR